MQRELPGLADEVVAEAVVRLGVRQYIAGLAVDRARGEQVAVGPEHDLAVAGVACETRAGVDELPAHFNPMRVVTVDDAGWARLFVGNEPVKRRAGRRQDMPKAWVLNGAIYLFRTAVLFDPAEPSMYGDRVAAYRMPPPYGFNIDEPEDWATAERLLTELAAR